jgi:tetratricopeptide (TPR) repeat protein
LSPDSVMAQFLRGRAAYDDKDYATALEAFEKVIAQRSDWAEAYRYRGLSYSHSGQHQRAIVDYQEAIALDPDYGSAYNDLGWAYTELGQLELARSNLDKAIELEPNMFSARVNRAKLFAKEENFRAEEKELAIIVGLYPKNQWAKDTLEAVRQKLQ